MMNMRLNLLLALALGLCLISCAQGGDSPEDVPSAATGPAKAAPAAAYNSVPADTIQMLFQECDYIDYVFYYTNFSVSQNTPSDIQTALSYISADVPEVLPQCKPVGHIFYQVRGENRAEADLYFDNTCIYMMFYEDGKPAYANKLMPAGIAFFNQLFQNTQAR